MTFGKAILIMALVASGAGIGISAPSGTAFASAAPTGTGTLTCSVEGEVYFYPPLTQYGTLSEGPGNNREIAYFSLGLTGCTGPGSNTPQPNPTTATVSGKSEIHLKDQKVPFDGHYVKVLGDCSIGDFPRGNIKNTEIWMGGSSVKKSTTTLNANVTGGSVHGTSKGSYSGDASGTLNLTTDSSDEYQSVCDGDGDGTGSISDLTFDSTTSYLTFG